MKQISIYLLFAIALVACDAKQQILENKPNIVFLYTDDQTYETVRALGHNEIQTPNLDRLINTGTTFTHSGFWEGGKHWS